MSVYLRPKCRTPHYGDRGRDVMAVKYALRHAGYKRGLVLDARFGTALRYQLHRYQRAHNLPEDGYTDKTHALLKYHIAAVPYGTWLWNNQKCPPKLPSTRQLIVNAALFGYHNNAAIHYTQSGLRMYGVRNRIRPPAIPRYEDCSSFATWCYWLAGAPDPNGLSYNGYGYTGTQTRHGTQVVTPLPGDLVFYGGSHYVPTHVAIYIGGGNVVSHGSEYGPNLRSVRYRTINHIRSYLPR